MATIMEQRAKFRELRTSGISREDAQKQAYGDILPVTPTSQINQDRLAQNQANRQNQIATGAVPPVGQQSAPVNPTVGTTTPSGATMNADGTVTPTSSIPLTEQQKQDEIKINAQYGGFIQDNGINSRQPINAPTQMPAGTNEPVKRVASAVTPKTEAPIDYTQAKGREAEIQANLDAFKAKGMTPDEIMRASDYANASPEKKALIDPYLKVQVPIASAMYNAIVSKADIPDDQKTTLPFKIAQNRYTKASSFSTMTPSQLANEMNNSRFIQGSQAYEDVKAMNPKLVQDTENLRIVNGSKQNVFTYINNPDGTPVKDENGTPVKQNNLEKTFAEDFMDNFGEVIKNMYSVQTPEQIRAIIYTDDVKQAQDKATEIELSMNELEKQIDQVDADVDKELAGSGATGSRIALEKASRKDKLEKEYNSQLKNYTTYANKANNLITQNTTVYTTQQQQKQAQNAAMLPFITDQYKTEQEKIKAEQALNDPATAIQTAIDEYKKLGIPFTSTVQSRLAEFKNSGLSLPDYLTKMRQNIQESPAYQQYQAQQAGKGISYETFGDKVYKNTNGVLTDTGISAKTTPEAKAPEWKQDASGNWYNANSTTSPGLQVSAGVKATGNIVPVTAGNKTVRLDQVGAGGFENAINQLKSAGLSVVVGEGVRDQTATIKSMADRYGIPFNASNPAETAQKLRNAGHQVADPGKSNHESGMAIDVYGDNNLGKVTPEQEKILNSNGWYSAGIPGDAGHFEYRGGTTGTETSQIEKDATLERIRRGQVTDSELGKIQQKAIAGGWGTDFTEALKKGMKTTLTDTQIKGLATVDDKIQKDTVLDNVNLVSQQKETIKGLLNTDINANGFNDIALINAFQKIVDPGVSVKEGDVALLQSGIALKDKLNPNNMLASVSAGTKLTPETRKQMLDSTVAIYNAQADFGNDLMKKKYYKLADNYGINLADYGYSYDKIDSKGKTIKPISEILPGATGFKSFMSELTTLLQ